MAVGDKTQRAEFFAVAVGDRTQRAEPCPQELCDNSERSEHVAPGSGPDSERSESGGMGSGATTELTQIPVRLAQSRANFTVTDNALARPQTHAAAAKVTKPTRRRSEASTSTTQVHDVAVSVAALEAIALLVDGRIFAPTDRNQG